MLGVVKMEGHEHAEWTNYYGEPEVNGNFGVFACARVSRWLFVCGSPTQSPKPPPSAKKQDSLSLPLSPSFYTTLC